MKIALAILAVLSVLGTFGYLVVAARPNLSRQERFQARLQLVVATASTVIVGVAAWRW